MFDFVNCTIGQNEHIKHIIFAILTVIVSVFFIVGMKVYGNLKVGSVGTDLNLLTYGFLWDTSVKAFNSENFWPSMPHHLIEYRGLILFVIAFVNLILLAWNMKISAKIELSNGEENFYIRRILTPVSYAFGLTSLFVFMYVQACWS